MFDAKEYQARYRAERREQNAVYAREYRKTHPDMRVRNTEKDRAYQRAYREANAERIAAQVREWREANRERNLELKEQAARRRRARLAGVAHEEFTRDEVFDRDGWVCGICGEPVDPSLSWPDPMFKSLDHIVPIAKGGANTRENVQCAHALCNATKSARLD